jgi:hypothetical protein
MERIQLIIGDKELTFSVKFEHDQDAGAPWENSDCHGPVTDWERRDKRPGELVLNSGRSGKRFYDFAEACRIARRDGWDAAPYNDGSETKRQQAAKAALADFEYLRQWCTDQWKYVGVIVTLLDDEGEETEVSESLWCVETRDDYHHEEARLLAGELACGYGVRWGETEKQTFGYWKGEVAA